MMRRRRPYQLTGCFESLLYLCTYLMSFHFLRSFFLCFCFSSIFLRQTPHIFAHITHQNLVTTCTYVNVCYYYAHHDLVREGIQLKKKSFFYDLIIILVCETSLSLSFQFFMMVGKFKVLQLQKNCQVQRLRLVTSWFD